MIIPPFLKPGDKFAIISPSGTVLPERVDGAVCAIEKWGFVPVVGEHCKEEYHAYSVITHSASPEHRLADLQWALNDPQVRAILCSRGGYGAVHLLEDIDLDHISRDPKWLIGFSDISALHAAWHRAGVVSIHSPMAKHLTLYGSDNETNRINYNILTGKGLPTYNEPPHRHNRNGRATATITGGNLAVLMGLLATPYNIIKPGNILFIEDVAEQVYQVQRLLYHLRLADILPRLAGLIVGQFTKHRGDDTSAMLDMIHDMVAPYDYPVAFNFPIGHVQRNVPIVEGTTATLEVGDTKVKLTMNY
ncbi:MAG: LD-carboxypeptidase [Muribaculaceae bacterium]|nr:LD-carboxypeptidase [Muribaculaceae bacterium]